MTVEQQNQHRVFTAEDMKSVDMNKVYDSLLRSNKWLREKVLPLSFTRINCLLDCPYKFYLNYILRTELPPKTRIDVVKSPFNTAGSFIHSVLEAYFIYFDYNRASQVNNQYKDFDQCWVEVKKAYEKKGELTTDVEEKIDFFRSGAEHFADDIKETMENHNLISLTELKFRIDFDKSLRRVEQYPFGQTFLFYGAADVILISKEKKLATIYDYKTYEKKVDDKKDKQGEVFTQLNLYSNFLFDYLNKFYGVEKTTSGILYVPSKDRRMNTRVYTKKSISELDVKFNARVATYASAATKFAIKYTQATDKKELRSCRIESDKCNYCDYIRLCNPDAGGNSK